jgi:hypothetical protein
VAEARWWKRLKGSRRTCLENVLFINPNNENAKQGLKVLSAKTGAAATAVFDASAVLVR